MMDNRDKQIEYLIKVVHANTDETARRVADLETALDIEKHLKQTDYAMTKKPVRTALKNRLFETLAKLGVVDNDPGKDMR